MNISFSKYFVTFNMPLTIKLNIIDSQIPIYIRVNRHAQDTRNDVRLETM